MTDPADETPDVPVFRLVKDTRDLPVRVRFQLALEQHLLEAYKLPAVPAREELN